MQDKKLDEFRNLINTTFKCGHILELSAHTTVFACYLLHRCWSASKDHVHRNLQICTSLFIASKYEPTPHRYPTAGEFIRRLFCVEPKSVIETLL